MHDRTESLVACAARGGFESFVARHHRCVLDHDGHVERRCEFGASRAPLRAVGVQAVIDVDQPQCVSVFARETRKRVREDDRIHAAAASDSDRRLRHLAPDVIEQRMTRHVGGRRVAGVSYAPNRNGAGACSDHRRAWRRPAPTSSSS